jgi:hypothetical protein
MGLEGMRWLGLLQEARLTCKLSLYRQATSPPPTSNCAPHAAAASVTANSAPNRPLPTPLAAMYGAARRSTPRTPSHHHHEPSAKRQCAT